MGLSTKTVIVQQCSSAAVQQRKVRPSGLTEKPFRTLFCCPGELLPKTLTPALVRYCFGVLLVEGGDTPPLLLFCCAAALLRCCSTVLPFYCSGALV